MKRLIINILFIFIAGFLIISLSKNIFDYQKKISFYKNYQDEYDKEKKHNQQLQSEIKKSQDYYTVEKTIREKLNLLKPNEIAIILPHKIPTTSPTPYIEKPPYQQWIDLVSRK